MTYPYHRWGIIAVRGLTRRDDSGWWMGVGPAVGHQWAIILYCGGGRRMGTESFVSTLLFDIVCAAAAEEEESR